MPMANLQSKQLSCLTDSCFHPYPLAPIPSHQPRGSVSSVLCSPHFSGLPSPLSKTKSCWGVQPPTGRTPPALFNSWSLCLSVFAPLQSTQLLTSGPFTYSSLFRCHWRSFKAFSSIKSPFCFPIPSCWLVSTYPLLGRLLGGILVCLGPVFLWGTVLWGVSLQTFQPGTQELLSRSWMG